MTPWNEALRNHIYSVRNTCEHSDATLPKTQHRFPIVQFWSTKQNLSDNFG